MKTGMSNCRIHNDTLSYQQNIRESLGPGRYYLTASPKPNATAPTDPRVSSQGYPVTRCALDLVDVDSEMLGISRKLGSCIESKFNPNRDAIECLNHPSFENIASELEPEDCRLSNPPCTLRGHGWNRFEWLCTDPQEQAVSRIPQPVNFRLVVKDNHAPLIEEPLADRSLPRPSVRETDYFVDKDIQSAIDSIPELPEIHHWRDADEVRRISCVRRRA